jgi:autotransporter family porin
VEIFIERSNSSINDKLKYKDKLFIFGLVLIGLAIIFSYGVGNVSAASGDTIYVNGNSTLGNDDWDGQYATYQPSTTHGPKYSIKNATRTVNIGGTVNIANGQYTGINNTQIIIDKNMNITGQSNAGTIINGTGTNWIFQIISGITLNIKKITITNGTRSYGGAIYNQGNLNITGCTFTNNTATFAAGAIINDGGTLSITNCTFTSNAATSYGGAIFNIATGILNVTGGTFNFNTATMGYGGAIYNDNAMNITGSTFTSNAATNYGGAIYNNAVLPVSVTGCTLTGNNASGGSAIYNDDGTLTITGSTFSNNKANNNGAIYTVGTLTVRDCTFTGNSVTSGNGGGAIVNNGILNLTGSTFTGNTVTNIGGAIINFPSGTLNITDCTFTSNIATNTGGAILNNGILNITGSTFTDNSVTKYGGAIWNSGTANVHFSRIVGNTAATGSAINNNAGTVDASLNWWGDNNDPNGKISGLTVNKWLILTITANPTTIGNGGFSLITADLKHDNTKTLQTGGYVQDGIPVSFITTLGTMGSPSSMVNGVSHATLHAGTVSGPATVSTKLDNQTVKTSVKIMDTIPPKVSSTTPTNLKTGVNRWSSTSIKFNELIKNSSYYYKITIKNLTTGKYSTLTKTITGNTLNLKTSTKTPNTWYQVTIPRAAIKDYTGNNLQATYTFRFKTGP